MAKKHIFRRLLKKGNNHSSLILNHLYGLHSFAFYILIFDFPSRIPLMSLIVSTYVHIRHLYNCKEAFTDVMSALQINLFMQNKANFRKSQMNVSKVLTSDYVKMDTWSSSKNKPNSNPIQTQFKANTNPIKAKTNPKQSQFQSQYMKITGRHDPSAYEADLNVIDKTNCILSINCVIISKYSRSNKMQLSEECCPNFNEGVNLCTETK